MKSFAIALLALASIWAQKPQESGPNWSAQQSEFWNMSSDLSQALKAMGEKPKQPSENVMMEGTCGMLFVYTAGTKDAKGSDVITNPRTTFDGQKLTRVSFCWLNEVRRRFAAEEIEAKNHPAVESFMKDVKLAFLTESDSAYLRLVNVYCSNGGTFYTSLTGSVSECPSVKSNP